MGWTNALDLAQHYFKGLVSSVLQLPVEVSCLSETKGAEFKLQLRMPSYRDNTTHLDLEHGGLGETQ